MFVKKRPEHKTLSRTLVSNTMNCNCISILEGTSKLVKRLKQVFLLIKQSVPLFALLLCNFRFLKTIRLLFLNSSCCFWSGLCSLPFVFYCFVRFALLNVLLPRFAFAVCLTPYLLTCDKCFLFNFYNELLLKLPKLFAKIQNTVVQEAKLNHRLFNICCQLNSWLSWSTTNFKSDQSVLAIHDSPPYCWDQCEHDVMTYQKNPIPIAHEHRLWTSLMHD